MEETTLIDDIIGDPIALDSCIAGLQPFGGHEAQYRKP